MKRIQRITESDLRRMVNACVKRILREGKSFNIEPMKYFGSNFDDEGETMLDIKYRGTYRVVWDIVEQERMYKYREVDSGEEDVQSERDAVILFNKIVRKFYGMFARTLRIEKCVDTYIGERWETVWDVSHDYIRKDKILK